MRNSLECLQHEKGSIFLLYKKFRLKQTTRLTWALEKTINSQKKNRWLIFFKKTFGLSFKMTLLTSTSSITMGLGQHV